MERELKELTMTIPHNMISSRQEHNKFVITAASAESNCGQGSDLIK